MFDVIVGVYDYNGIFLESLYGSYIIKISLSNSGELLGNTSGITVNGECNFNGLSITTAGNYQFIAKTYEKSSGNNNTVQDSISTESVEITKAQIYMPVSTIDIYYNNENPEEYLNYEITIFIKDTYGNISSIQYDIYISSTSLYNGPSIIKSVSGIATFVCYFTSPEKVSLTIAVSDISKTISLNVKEVIFK